MTDSSISLASIRANYTDPKGWADVASRTLSDGTRLVETECGNGFRVYRPSGGFPEFVQFTFAFAPYHK